MRRHMICVALVLAGTGPAAGQQADPMEMQRCVWRCLNQFGPASNPAYHDCVQRVCVPDRPRWSGGQIRDGSGEYAAVGTADGRFQLYYLCGRAGQSALVLSGLEGPSAVLSLVVDGRPYDLSFEGEGGAHAVGVPPGSPILSAMATGQTLTVRNVAGYTVATFGLDGAGAEISAAQARCR
ncbi:hypothetical protein [Rhodovulum adriaticum]|uniref:Uncharacterized protein n=1 Tax=Rhodovulum adriaticum TaxID=35804 RepID=A0A4R2NXF6_RHOAD|nr:hypothetical protein [Rhodovulum adriaticum]MBK1636606.1 hypothetical protein [Rhodovulum adriaticum]TCP26095.1 hypothetical protein EV656_10257 [Rhodovulum adriaticum]